MKEITLEEVYPSLENWNEFLELATFYFKEKWPKEFKEQTSSEIKLSYSKELLYRLQQGGRGLFIFRYKNTAVGLSNVYLENRVLNISEFYIIPKNRKLKMGTNFLNKILDWGVTKGATSISIEVDSDLQIANNFWASFGLQKNKDIRVRYFGLIASIKVVNND